MRYFATLCIVTLAGLCIQYGCSNGGDSARSATSISPEVYKLVYFQGGRQTHEVEIHRADSRYDKINAYVRSVVQSRGESSIINYAPQTLIESDLIILNIMSEIVVISVRSSSDDAWTQSVRRRSSGDDEIIVWINSFLLK